MINYFDKFLESVIDTYEEFDEGVVAIADESPQIL